MNSFTLNQPSFEGILQLKLLASFPAMLRCARVLVTSPSISARIFQPFSLSTRYRHNKAGKGDRKNPKKPWWVQSKEATNSVDPVVLEAEVRERSCRVNRGQSLIWCWRVIMYLLLDSQIYSEYQLCTDPCLYIYIMYYFLHTYII